MLEDRERGEDEVQICSNGRTEELCNAVIEAWERIATLETALRLADDAFACWGRMGDAMHQVIPAHDDVTGASEGKWQAVVNTVFEADEMRPRVIAAFRAALATPTKEATK
jgi:hypothetical protein